MGPEDKIEFTESLTADKGFIPGLDVDPNSTIAVDIKDSKKVPYSKPIPRNFQAHWNDTGKMDDDESQPREIENRDFSRAPSVDQPIVVPQTPPQPVQTVCGIVVYEKFIPVVPGSKLSQIVSEGINSLNKFISSGDLEEVKDLIPKEECKSPPVKKSRFEQIVDHKPVIIYNDTPESKQYQNNESNPTNINIPSLMNLKLSNPESNQIKEERDWNGGRFNENDRQNSSNNNNLSNNNHNARSNGRTSRFTDSNNRNGGIGGGDARRRRRRH